MDASPHRPTRAPVGHARRRIALVVLVGLLLVSATACFVPDFQGVPDGRRVVVLGDSITAFAEEPIRAGLEDRYLASVTGEPRYSSSQVRLATFGYDPADADGGVVVVNAGTNDVLQDIGVGTALDNLAGIRAYFGERCFIPVLVNQHTFFGPLNEWAAWFNFYVVFSGAYPIVVDWDGAVRADPGLVGVDTVHPTDRGNEVLAGLIAEAVDRCPASA
jgi:lysophospholipase L1-like esterase